MYPRQVRFKSVTIVQPNILLNINMFPPWPWAQELAGIKNGWMDKYDLVSQSESPAYIKELDSRTLAVPGEESG